MGNQDSQHDWENFVVQLCPTRNSQIEELCGLDLSQIAQLMMRDFLHRGKQLKLKEKGDT